MLTTDQRAVLLHLKNEELLLDGFAWDRLMSSHRGGCRPGSPEHSISSYDCGRGKIVADWFDGTQTVITKAQMAKGRNSLDPTLRDRLRDALLAFRRESTDTIDWCMCPQQRGEGKCFGSFTGRKRHHPTDAEYDAHRRRLDELRDRLDAAFGAVLGFADEPAPGEQLELFGAAS